MKSFEDCSKGHQFRIHLLCWFLFFVLTFTRSMIGFFFPLHWDWQMEWLKKHINTYFRYFVIRPILWTLLYPWVIYFIWCVFPWIHKILFCHDVSSRLWDYKCSWLNLFNGWSHIMSLSEGCDFSFCSQACSHFHLFAFLLFTHDNSVSGEIKWWHLILI